MVERFRTQIGESTFIVMGKTRLVRLINLRKNSYCVGNTIFTYKIVEKQNHHE